MSSSSNYSSSSSSSSSGVLSSGRATLTPLSLSHRSLHGGWLVPAALALATTTTLLNSKTCSNLPTAKLVGIDQFCDCRQRKTPHISMTAGGLVLDPHMTGSVAMWTLEVLLPTVKVLAVALGPRTVTCPLGAVLCMEAAVATLSTALTAALLQLLAEPALPAEKVRLQLLCYEIIRCSLVFQRL